MARYKLVRTPNPKKDGEPMPYHARYIAYRTFRLDDMVKSTHTTFSKGEIRGVIELIQDTIINELLNGNNVELEGIGTFTASIECPPVMNPKEIRAESIRFRSVLFRPSAILCRRLKGMRFSRLPEEKNIQTFTLAERRERMLEYLSKHKRLTGNAYMRLNNCSRTRTCEDLKLFRQEGLVSRYGRGPTTYYVKIMH